MDAFVPARTSGTPFATSARSGPSYSVGALVPPHPASAKHRPKPAPSPKPRWSGSARQLARRKPTRRQDEHPP